MTSFNRRRTTAATFALIAGVALLTAGHTVLSAQKKNYGVSLKIAKKPELAKVKTYSWTPGQQAFDKTVDAQIKAAVDRELAARGLTKAEPGPGDVLATYHSLTRTDVDLKAKAPEGARPQYPVGTLVIDLLSPANRQPLFRVRVDKPIAGDPAQMEAIINEAVAAMFEKYPAPASK